MTTYGTGQQHLNPEHEQEFRAATRLSRPAWIREAWIRDVIERVDAHLDANTAPAYQEQPLAGHWARIGKAQSEANEAVEALAGVTGENPRKGVCDTWEHVCEELADTACAGLLGIQHVTKDIDQTWRIFLAALAKAESRVTATETAYHPDPEISAEVAADAAEAERADLAAGFPVRRWRCPECRTEHDRGHFGTIGMHRCLSCGYNGTGGVMLDEHGECG